jgi:hypothetical protein
MKKFLVLTLMLLLGMSVMASDVTISGETLFEWFGDFGAEYQYNGDVELVVKAVVDDYNTANVDFDYAQDATGSPSMITLDRGYFVTAIGKYAGVEEMGVTIDLTWGYNEFDDESYAQIDEYEMADIWEAKYEAWGVGVDVGVMDIVHFEFTSAPMPGVNQTTFGVYGGMDPVWVQVYYDRDGNVDLADGSVGLTALFGMDVMPGMFAIKVQGSFVYSLNADIDAADDVFATQKYAWSAAVATDIMEMAYVDVSVAGVDDSMFAFLWFNLGAHYQGMVGLDVGVGTVLDDAILPEMLDEIEASVWTKVGAAKFRVGYLKHADQQGAANYYKGVYAPSDGDYNYVAAESGVIFFSGDLDY